MPKVSVILSSYNHAQYVAKSIESVLNQTFTDFELLIFDDGSNDNSREIIKSFSDPRIKLFLHEENRGPNICFKECLSATCGKYIAIHHSDDVWALDKLEKQVEFLDSHEDYAACFSYADFIDEDGNFYESEGSDIFKKENRSRAEWLNYFFYKSNCICHPSILIYRDAYEKYGLKDTQGLWQLPDYFMWIHLCFNSNFYIMPENFVHFRMRKKNRANISAPTFNSRVRVETEMVFVLKMFAESFTDDKFFLEVFPEAEKFLVDKKIHRNFAFAKICLSNTESEFAEVFQLVGLEILKKLLTNPTDAEQIKNLYNYDEKSFFVDTGNFDIFNIKQKFSMLYSFIFIDGEKNFAAVDDKYVFVEPSGKFYAKFNFTVDKPVKMIRFDPDENFISVKLENFLVNGENFTIYQTNAAKIVDGFYRFITWDPQFVFETENLSGDILIEVSGFIDRDYLKIMNQDILELQNKNKQLQNKNEQLQNWGETLEKEMFRLDAEVNNLRAEISAIKNSTSWKITKPLRDFKTFMRKRK